MVFIKLNSTEFAELYIRVYDVSVPFTVNIISESCIQALSKDFMFYLRLFLTNIQQFIF